MDIMRMCQYICTVLVVGMLLFTYYNMWKQSPKNRRKAQMKRSSRA